MSSHDSSNGGYDAQSEDESTDDLPRRHHKRFTRRSQRPLPEPKPPNSSSLAGSSGHSSTGYGTNVERSDSGHILLYDAQLQAWRRNVTSVRRQHKPTSCLTATEITPQVKELRCTASGSQVVYDRKRACWRRERRLKTVNFGKLTLAQQEARQTPSGTDIYFDERRLEWRRKNAHASDVPTPSGPQALLRRTGSGSAIVYDNTRQVWKRKLKRQLTDPDDAERHASYDVVQSNGRFFVQKKRKHLEEDELTQKEMNTRCTRSGSSIYFDDSLRKWKREPEFPEDSPTSGMRGRSDANNAARRRSHRHHHGSKRTSYTYTKNKLTGKWTKKQYEEHEQGAKRLRMPDGGYVYFDYNRGTWRKVKREFGDERHRRQRRKVGFFARVKEFLFDDSDEDDDADDRRSDSDWAGELSTPESGQHMHTRGHPDEVATEQARSERHVGLCDRIRGFFLSICKWLRLC